MLRQYVLSETFFLQHSISLVNIHIMAMPFGGLLPRGAGDHSPLVVVYICGFGTCIKTVKNQTILLSQPPGIPVLKVNISPTPNMATKSRKFQSLKQYQHACIFEHIRLVLELYICYICCMFIANNRKYYCGQPSDRGRLKSRTKSVSRLTLFNVRRDGGPVCLT